MPEFIAIWAKELPDENPSRYYRYNPKPLAESWIEPIFHHRKFLLRDAHLGYRAHLNWTAKFARLWYRAAFS